MCGGNYRRLRMYISIIFIPQTGTKHIYCSGLHKPSITASLFGVTHHPHYLTPRGSPALYSWLPAISTRADDALVVSYHITWPVYNIITITVAHSTTLHLAYGDPHGIQVQYVALRKQQKRPGSRFFKEIGRNVVN